jgi:hypothetical protein
MSHTYSTNLVHCVFSTKNRADFILADLHERLYAYLFGTARSGDRNSCTRWYGKPHPHPNDHPTRAATLVCRARSQNQLLTMDG